jgi:phosphate transport system substrate-binding protein
MKDNPMKLNSVLAAAALAAVAVCVPQPVFAQAISPADFVMKNIRPPEGTSVAATSSAAINAKLSAEVDQKRYKTKYDLSGLPSYQPKRQITGTVRLWGTNYISNSGLDVRWRDAFLKYHPKAKMELVLPSAAVAAPALYFGTADVTMNHELTFYDYLSHERILGYAPTGFSVINGSFDISGWQNTMAVVVHKDNPLAKITMEELDGVFGSQRVGGWDGFTWRNDWARGPEKNIRTWGQLGLKGDWTNKTIQTYGYSIRYATAVEFSNKVLKASDKWNDNIMAYGNATGADGKRVVQVHAIMAALKKDPNGIAYVRWQPGFDKDVKVLALAQDASGPYYDFTPETVRTRKYPLWGDQSFWVSVKPGSKIDPKVAEFVRFVLSREGQQLVMEDGLYLPLAAEASRHELAKLERVE